MPESIVIMGVAGCGKSSLGQAVAQALGMPLIEGDDYHSAQSRHKMAQGVPLDDADRQGWLGTLADKLRTSQGGVVLTCSALKRAYRYRLRQGAPGLRFVFLEIDREHAYARVQARAKTHFFSGTLVDSQFQALEPPTGEAGVLCVDALLPLAQLQAQVAEWAGPAKAG